jgi:hypothetical protein
VILGLATFRFAFRQRAETLVGTPVTRAVSHDILEFSVRVLDGMNSALNNFISPLFLSNRPVVTIRLGKIAK